MLLFTGEHHGRIPGIQRRDHTLHRGIQGVFRKDVVFQLVRGSVEVRVHEVAELVR